VPSRAANACRVAFKDVAHGAMVCTGKRKRREITRAVVRTAPSKINAAAKYFVILA
jgi:hypothetical protein